MIIDELLKNPAVKRALSAGEERMGKLVTQLLSSERVMHRVQTVLTSALTAKSTFDRGLRSAMSAVSLPSTEEVEELRRKLAELETMLDGLAAKLERRRAAAPVLLLLARQGKAETWRSRPQRGHPCAASPSSTRRAGPARPRSA